MERLVADVRAAVAAEAWHSALALALALPDICGFVEAPTAGSQARYVQWFDRKVAPGYSAVLPGGPKQFLNGTDCYALRCAFLHQGEFDITDKRARDALKRFRFVVPPPSFTVHKNLIGETLQLQVSEFCEDICKAVEAWLTVAKCNPDRAPRIANLASIEIYEPGKGFRI